MGCAICTAVSFHGCGHYFGRNLDLDFSYGESVAIAPRRFDFHFRHASAPERRYAMIGMAHMAGNYPMFYDATNEKGLSAAGLNFPGNAVYHPLTEGKENVTASEVIAWILCQCATLSEARTLLDRMNITTSQSDQAATLHWIVADKTGALTVESTEDGLHVYDNPMGVLANNPPFPYHRDNLIGYMNLTSRIPANRFSDRLDLKPYCVGMGGIGLPGDLSSASRFVRAAFTALHAEPGSSREESISQMFHILGSVEQTRGCVDLENGRYETTFYTSCCDTERGIYYYTTYYNRQITGVDLHKTDLDVENSTAFPLILDQQIRMEN